jgi:hypothetical protein
MNLVSEHQVPAASIAIVNTTTDDGNVATASISMKNGGLLLLISDNDTVIPTKKQLYCAADQFPLLEIAVSDIPIKVGDKIVLVIPLTAGGLQAKQVDFLGGFMDTDVDHETIENMVNNMKNHHSYSMLVAVIADKNAPSDNNESESVDVENRKNESDKDANDKDASDKDASDKDASDKDESDEDESDEDESDKDEIHGDGNNQDITKEEKKQDNEPQTDGKLHQKVIPRTDSSSPDGTTLPDGVRGDQKPTVSGENAGVPISWVSLRIHETPPETPPNLPATLLNIMAGVGGSSNRSSEMMLLFGGR